MSKKDYIILADAVKHTVNQVRKNESIKSVANSQLFIISVLVTSLCVRLKEDNPNFDQEKFMIACDILPKE